MYDITNSESFNKLKILYNEVKEAVDIDHVLVFIVGNKNDMYLNEQVKKNVAEEYTKSINGTYRCVSALKSTGIKELFEYVGQSLLKVEARESNGDDLMKPKSNKEFSLKKDESKTPKKRKCC